ncbi:unnamed protein product [Amoebophrya sp. A25]|nr:unnamed protein product [Amoebophrya sp. A25]|eukprot:GSA25T00018759001.1
MESMLGSYSRPASHAGSWYTDDPDELRESFRSWITEAGRTMCGGADGSSMRSFSAGSLSSRARAVIAPHAGYSYSGPTAAYAYFQLLEALRDRNGCKIRRVVVLHPSHHVYLNTIALTGAHELNTVLGPLPVDVPWLRSLLSLQEETASSSSTGAFPCGIQVMNAKVDTDEHSGEMHYPYIRYCLEEAGQAANVKVAALMVGSMDATREAAFGKALRKMMIDDPSNFFVLSSDFCHWGRRFDFCPCPAAGQQPISSYIEELDREGMDLMCTQDPWAFDGYLRRTQNTICGRHPISLFLFMLSSATTRHKNNLQLNNTRGEEGSLRNAEEDEFSIERRAGSKRSKSNTGGARYENFLREPPCPSRIDEKHPIFTIEHLRYAQSGEVFDARRDSSVSYVSMVIKEATAS